MKAVRNLFILLLIFLSPALLHAEETATVDIPEIVLEHISDAYEWHVYTYKGKPVSIPLPIIVRSGGTGKWFAGTAEHLPAQFFFNEERHGKIYETLPDGSIVRPLDLSITKSVAQIWIVVIILVVLFLSLAGWYKKRNERSEAPKGFVGCMEMLVMMVNDDIVKSSIGEKHYKPYAPYLLTVFFFILTTNMLGLLPIFPGGANVTGNINVTFLLALFSMMAINLFGNKEYWKDIFWPHVPLALKCPVPLLPVIELVGVFTKPFALMIRLFANMMAGHAVILSFTCVIFLGWTISVGFGIGLNIFGVIMLLFANCLEFLVAFVQAYVFTLLSAVFIGLAHKEEE
ncbi:MAG: F0F1 ATP synthase subunit A [Prevotella sp.]|nr:F0F1 ATP synthase subunit A [Prevotella sp.]